VGNSYFRSNGSPAIAVGRINSGAALPLLNKSTVVAPYRYSLRRFLVHFKKFVLCCFVDVGPTLRNLTLNSFFSKFRSLVLKNVRSTGICIRKNQGCGVGGSSVKSKSDS